VHPEVIPERPHPEIAVPGAEPEPAPRTPHGPVLGGNPRAR
jgi:hypothetical protein